MKPGQEATKIKAMRTQTIKIYKYSELSDKAKEKALEEIKKRLEQLYLDKDLAEQREEMITCSILLILYY